MKRKLTADDLEKVARMLSKQYGVRVLIRGSKCRTDKKTIYLPVLPDMPDDRLISLVRYFLDHEVGHIVGDSDDECLMSIQEKYGEAGRLVLNSLEDVRVENRMSSLYRGCGINLEKGADLIEDDAAAEAMAKSEHAQMAFALYNAGHGRPIPDAVGPRVRRLLDPFMGEIQSTIEAAKSTGDIMPLARRILDAIAEDNKQQAAEGEKKAEAKRAKRRRAGRLKAKARSKHKQPEQGEVDGGEEQGEQGEGGEGNEASQAGSDSDGDEQQGDGGCDSGDASGSDAGDEGDSGCSGDQGEQTPPEESGDEAAADGGCGDGSEVDSSDGESGCSSDDGGSDSDDGVDSRPGAGNQPPDFSLKGNAVGRDQALTEAIDREMQNVTNMMDSNSVSRPCIPNQWMPWVKSEFRGFAGDMPQFDRELSSVGGAARQRLMQLLQSESRSWWAGGLKKGLPDPAAIAALAAKTSDRVLRRRVEHKAPNTAIHMTIDGSGSMRNHMMRPAALSAAAFSKVMTSCRYAHAITVFTSYCGGYQDGYYEACSDAVYGEKNHGQSNITRDLCTLHVLKAWHESHRMVYPRLVAMGSGHGTGGTPLDMAIYEAARDLGSRPEKRKIVIAFTDGYPNEPRNTKAVIKAVERQGVEVILIGMLFSGVETLHTRVAVVRNIKDLASATLVSLQKAMGR